MDRVAIKNLEVFAYHGVMPEENIVGQKFIISVDMYVDNTKAVRDDEINKAVNYAEVSEFIKSYVENHTYKLIETLAERLAEHILLTFDRVYNLVIEIAKPWAPVHMPLDTVSVKIERGWHIAHLSIGSNMGDKEAHLDKAVAAIDDCLGIQLMRVSDYIVTSPVGYTNQDDFLNAAVTIRTLLSPHKLLDTIHGIEADDGRVRDIHWGPRTIDIDIILYDDLIMGDEELIIPHKEAAKRMFVLKPLAQIAPYAIHPVYNKTVQQLYEEMIEADNLKEYEPLDTGFFAIDMLDVNEDTRIAYFGVEGTYSQQAMEDFFGEGGYVSYALPKFTDVMEAVSSGEADYGVIPIENSSTGGVTDIYDHMHEYDIYIVGSQIVKIEHALLGLPGSSIEDIKTVYSHNQGIRQCGSFFEAHPHITPVPVSDSTAAGAKKVLSDNDYTQGAIAAKRAAKLYGLQIIKEAVNDLTNNRTRFVIISGKKQYVSNSGRISLSFEVKHESGALYKMLSHFANYGINLEKIESRPIRLRNWEYRFFVDIAGNLGMQSVKSALAAVNEVADGMKILGNY